MLESMHRYLPLLLLLSTPLFCLNMDFPNQPAGEEIHYVKAARAWLETGADSNLEHPPLAKMIIAAGIALLGDEALGWRFFSALAGAGILIGMYYWSLALFEDRKTAWWTVTFSFLSIMLWTEARLATLEVYQVAFLIGACACCSRIWFGRTGSRQTVPSAGAGIMFGLAIACKWFALVAWIPCAVVTIGLALHKRRAKPIFSPPLVACACLLILPILVYMLTYAPYLAHQGLTRWIGLQGAMWTDQTDPLVAASAQPLVWYLWPFQLQPESLAVEREFSAIRVLGLIANPVCVWGGIVAAVISLRMGRERAWAAALFPALFFFSWAVIPHKHQHYYYFFPCVMALSLPLANARKVRWIVALLAAAVCAYYLPNMLALKTPVAVSI